MKTGGGVRVALMAAVVAAALAACGGGSSSSSTPEDLGPPLDPPASVGDAQRFLTQATFGPTGAEAARLAALGYSRWIDDQFAKPTRSHREYWDSREVAIRAVDANRGAGTREVLDTFYQQAVRGDDQLRARVAFALSQIFVISMQDGTVADNSRGVADWLDMLDAYAFGNYRDLLEAVATHPMMGIYLSHLKNQKENAATGRVPDENFAREVMQLFSIGLYELEANGTSRTGGDGKPMETYSGDDIAGLAKFFTGFSRTGPDTSDARFHGWVASAQDPDRAWRPMQGYPKFHSTSEKRFLGTSLGAQGGGDPNASLKVALDTLAAHPNVGPFIGRQLVQRLVTSNPSPAYVERVARVFSNNGAGVRGDLRAVVKAVLLDAEARDATSASDPAQGKLREPVLRMRGAVSSGVGRNGEDWSAARRDVQPSYAAELPLADKPAELVDRVTSKLVASVDTSALKADLRAAVEAVPLPALRTDASNQKQVDDGKRNRVVTAVLLTLVSPEFLVQK